MAVIGSEAHKKGIHKTEYDMGLQVGRKVLKLTLIQIVLERWAGLKLW